MLKIIPIVGAIRYDGQKFCALSEYNKITYNIRSTAEPLRQPKQLATDIVQEITGYAASFLKLYGPDIIFYPKDDIILYSCIIPLDSKLKHNHRWISENELPDDLSQYEKQLIKTGLADIQKYLYR